MSVTTGHLVDSSRVNSVIQFSSDIPSWDLFRNTDGSLLLAISTSSRFALSRTSLHEEARLFKGLFADVSAMCSTDWVGLVWKQDKKSSEFLFINILKVLQ